MTLIRTTIIVLALSLLGVFSLNFHKGLESEKGCVYKLKEDYSYTRAKNCECKFIWIMEGKKRFPAIIVGEGTYENFEYYYNY